MFWAIGAFAVWVLLCNFLLFLSSRRPPAKNFSRFCPAEAAKVSSGDDAEAGCRDGKAADPDARDKVVDGGNGRQEPAEGVGEVESSVLRVASASRYEFSEGKGISGFIEGPKAMSFVVQEMLVDSGETSPWKGKEILIHEQLEHSAGEEEEDEDGADQYFDVETFMETKPIGERDNEFEFVHEEDEGIEDNREEELSFHGDDDNSLEGSRIEYPEGFCRAGLEDEVLGEEDSRSDESQMSPDSEEGEDLTVKNSAAVTDQLNLSEDDEYIELELQEQRDLLPDNIFKEEEEEEDEQGKLGLGGSSSEFGVQKEPDCSTLDLDSDSDSDSDLDSLWEHDDIVEQLKLELKNVRTGGLPTILEEPESEYESPNTGRSDLKSMPMKIDDKKIENKDRLEEIQKVYKSYAERMKKLDILNSQTLHAIELVQLKDPLRSNSADGRFSVSKVTQNSRKSRWRRHQIDPVMESVGAHYKELKMVYIGQVCLSWEILQWQYGKVQELLASSCSRSAEQYNQVAGELQLFRVLLQRFLEDEPFRGSRVENYARSRRVLKSLLQVPAIKGKKNILFGHPFFASSIMVHFSDDCFKNKKARVRDEDAVSSAGLITLIEESMRVFWDFLHADKHEAYAVLAAGQQSADSDLVMSLRTQLQKKDRRLKEISRCKGCILKKLRKEDNEGLHHTLLLARVELRLISRVLKVGRLTRDQVSWCREKMDRINVTDRTIRVEKEPSFLLFPC